MTAAVVLAPHPDDEVLGASTVLLDGAATVVHVTDGVPPWIDETAVAALRERRHQECEAAWAALGAQVSGVVRFGFDDLTVWRSVRQLAAALVDLLADAGPADVHVPAYQGGHPDHDATFAAALLARRTTGRRHRWHAYGLYGYDSTRRLRFGALDGATYRVVTVGSTEADLAGKATALRCFASQLRPRSVVQRWLDDPAPETRAPLPARLPTTTRPCFYEEEFDFDVHGVTQAAVTAELHRALRAEAG